MKHIFKLSAIGLMLVLIGISGCNKSEVSPNEISTSLNVELSSFYQSERVLDQGQASEASIEGALPQALTASSDISFSGTLKAINLDDNNEKSFTWYGKKTDGSFALVSTKSIALEEGVYDFELSLKSGSQEYVGKSVNIEVQGDLKDINMSISPVIGDITSNYTFSELAKFKFKFDKEDIASLGNLSLELAIGGNKATMYSINPDTASIDTYVLVDEGEANITANLYQYGQKQIASLNQNSVIFSKGVDIDLTMSPISSDVVLSLTNNGGDLDLQISLPDEIKDEAGSLSNIQTMLYYQNANGNIHSKEVYITETQGAYEITTTLSNIYYGNFSFHINVFDSLNDNELIADSKPYDLILDNSDKTITIDIDVYRRAYGHISLLSTLGVNVFDDESNEALSGANIYIDDELKTITGGISGTTDGYAKLKLPRGNYTIKATYTDSTNTTKEDKKEVSISALGVSDIDLRVKVRDVVDGLVAYYPFDGNDNDISGNDNHGTAHGVVTYVDGVINKAIKFENELAFYKTNYASIPNISLENDFSHSFWFEFKSLSSSASEALLSCGSHGDASGYYAIWVNNNIVSMVYNTQSTITTNMTNGEFTNIASIKEGNELSLYVNGLKIDSIDAPSDIADSFTCYIGAHDWINNPYGSSNRYNGLIDDVRIYNRALNEDEIQTLYELGQ